MKKTWNVELVSHGYKAVGIHTLTHTHTNIMAFLSFTDLALLKVFMLFVRSDVITLEVMGKVQKEEVINGGLMEGRRSEA